MKMKRTIIYTLGLLVTSLSLFTGCSRDEDPDTDSGAPITTGYAISTVSGAWPNQTTYIQWFEDLNIGTLNNDDARELANSAGTETYNGALYAKPFGSPAKLVKYVVNSSGTPEVEQEIIVPGANTFSTIYFESETVAYATVAGGVSKLIIFDPSTMRITDEISLSGISDRYPEATRTYYLDMVARDNKLFMGVHYEINFSPINDSAYVAVIDLATNTFEKVIADGRTGMVFGGPAPNSGMVIDDAGAIYVQAIGTENAGGAAPSGLLRINAGSTDFDADYFFNLDEVVGTNCYGVYHTSSGRSFTANVQDEADFWEYVNGEPQFKYVEIDLAAKTSKGAIADLPVTYASRYMIIHEMDANTLLFTTATNDKNAVYKYDLSTDEISELFTSDGGYITGFAKLDE